jgi:hypothetical protein
MVKKTFSKALGLFLSGFLSLNALGQKNFNLENQEELRRYKLVRNEEFYDMTYFPDIFNYHIHGDAFSRIGTQEDTDPRDYAKQVLKLFKRSGRDWLLSRPSVEDWKDRIEDRFDFTGKKVELDIRRSEEEKEYDFPRIRKEKKYDFRFRLGSSPELDFRWHGLKINTSVEDARIEHQVNFEGFQARTGIFIKSYDWERKEIYFLVGRGNAKNYFGLGAKYGRTDDEREGFLRTREKEFRVGVYFSKVF